MTLVFILCCNFEIFVAQAWDCPQRHQAGEHDYHGEWYVQTLNIFLLFSTLFCVANPCPSLPPGHLKFVDFGTAKDFIHTDLNGPEFVGTSYILSSLFCYARFFIPHNSCCILRCPISCKKRPKFIHTFSVLFFLFFFHSRHTGVPVAQHRAQQKVWRGGGPVGTGHCVAPNVARLHSLWSSFALLDLPSHQAVVSAGKRHCY